MVIKEGIVICKNSIKKEIITNNPLKDYTFFTLETFVRNLEYNYEPRAIYELTKEYNISVSHSVNYLKNMLFIDKFYNINKIDKIYNMKQYLIKNGLMTNNPLFYDLVKSQVITIIDYEENYLVKYIKKKFNVTIINTKFDYKVFNIDKYESALDEVRGVFYNISSLINNGVDINSIVIVNGSSEYEFYLNRVSKQYNLKLNLKPKKNIMGVLVVKEFISLLDKFDNFKDILNVLKKSYSKSPYLNKIINLINSYKGYMYNPSCLKQCFIYEFSNMSFESKVYNNAINILDFDSYFDDSKYVFFIGFNEQIAYNIVKDIDLLSDSEKILLGIDTSDMVTKFNKDNLIKNINLVKNINLSYKLKSSFSLFEPSSLISELNMNIIDKDYLWGGSKLEDDMVLNTYLDTLRDYNVKSLDLEKYYYNGLDYMTYDNKFSGIVDLISDELSLSYTKMKMFYSCKFAFYLQYILKINSYEENLAALIGTYVHYILEKSYNDDFDICVVHNEFISSGEYSKKEIFFFNMFYQTIVDLVKFNKEHESNSKLSNTLCEETYNLSLRDSKLTFTGIIDKIKYKEEDNITYAAIMDYKTGNDKVSLDNIEDGQNMQLPIYMYMLRKSNTFSNVKLIGYYLQNIKVDSEDILKDNKLNGYTKDEESVISYLDSNYKKSDYITGLKQTTSGGFYKSSKLISQTTEDEIYLIVDNLINNAYDSIVGNDFSINPKKIGNEIISCKFCEFKDVCFRSAKDVVEIKKGGDDSEVE